MTTDYLELGSVPYDEDCVQVGDGDYLKPMRKECARFMKTLEKAYPPPKGARLFIKSTPHDFGAYLEVCVRYDIDTQDAIDYAFKLESDIPCTWKELEELAIKNE